MKKHANPLLILTLFYLIFFGHSLNIIRQYMAMALIFAFLRDIEDHKLWRYMLVVIFASMIHATAWLGLAPLAVYAILYTDSPIDGRFLRFNVNGSLKPSLKTRQITVISTLVALVLLFKPLCQLMIHIGILNEKYGYYMVTKPRSYAGIVTILLVLELIAAWVFRNQIKRKNSFAEFFLICSACYLILQQLTAVIVFGKRIAAYFSLINLVTIGVLDRSFEDCDKKTKWIVRGIIVTVALGYWWYFYVLRNASETIPYLFG